MQGLRQRQEALFGVPVQRPRARPGARVRAAERQQHMLLQGRGGQDHQRGVRGAAAQRGKGRGAGRYQGRRGEDGREPHAGHDARRPQARAGAKAPVRGGQVGAAAPPAGAHHPRRRQRVLPGNALGHQEPVAPGQGGQELGRPDPRDRREGLRPLDRRVQQRGQAGAGAQAAVRRRGEGARGRGHGRPTGVHQAGRLDQVWPAGGQGHQAKDGHPGQDRAGGARAGARVQAVRQGAQGDPERARRQGRRGAQEERPVRGRWRGGVPREGVRVGHPEAARVHDGRQQGDQRDGAPPGAQAEAGHRRQGCRNGEGPRQGKGGDHPEPPVREAPVLERREREVAPADRRARSPGGAQQADARHRIRGRRGLKGHGDSDRGRRREGAEAHAQGAEEAGAKVDLGERRQAQRLRPAARPQRAGQVLAGDRRGEAGRGGDHVEERPGVQRHDRG